MRGDCKRDKIPGYERDRDENEGSRGYPNVWVILSSVWSSLALVLWIAINTPYIPTAWWCAKRAQSYARGISGVTHQCCGTRRRGWERVREGLVVIVVKEDCPLCTTIFNETFSHTLNFKFLFLLSLHFILKWIISKSKGYFFFRLRLSIFFFYCSRLGPLRKVWRSGFLFGLLGVLSGVKETVKYIHIYITKWNGV